MITIYLMSKLFKKIIKYGLGGIVGVIIPYLLFVLLGKDTLSGVILFLVCSPAFALFGFALARTIVMRKINILFILASILFIISVIFILYLFVNAYYEDQANISSVNNFTKKFKEECNKSGYISGYEDISWKDYIHYNGPFEFYCERSSVSGGCERLSINYGLSFRHKNAPGTGERASSVLEGGSDYVYGVVVDCKNEK